ncbi:hypothetical protein AVEN_80271-1 [Araneus ventricosus]|uniref:DNA-directed DNA polymerase n=1 Tax=Araneus ventricosus TaxID=182803 RepID=A0A4Y2MJQ6_ARAVE|nr:hypothetical protein AVEN_80271-1 [Araneus ventricosus]
MLILLSDSVKHKKSKKQRGKSESESDVDSIVDDEFERNSVLGFKHRLMENEKLWNKSVHPETVQDKYDVLISDDLKKVEDNIPPLSVYIGSGFAAEVKSFRFTVLELSKLYMFQLYYDILKPVYKERINLIYTDTDSLCLEVLTDDFYNDLVKQFKNLMDFSNYDASHKYHSTKHQSLLGYLKDETRGVPIKEFCALRPKMYSYTFGKENKKTAKGT